MSREGPSVFISYPRDPSEPSALALHARLESRGIPTFLDSARIDVAEQISPSIVSAIRSARVFLVLATARYFVRPYCLLELEAALLPGDATRSAVPALVLPESGAVDLALLPPALADTHWPKVSDLDAVARMVDALLTTAPASRPLESRPRVSARQERRAPSGPLPCPASLGSAFVGREHDLWRLNFRLALRRRTGKRASVAVVGSAGVGKSSLVAEALSRDGAEFDAGVHFVDASRSLPEVHYQLHTVLSALDPHARPLSFYRSEPSGGELLTRDLHALLDTRRTSAATLFVLDNLPEADPDTRDSIVRAVPSNAHVVATSRADLAISACTFETLRLDPLDQADGAALLTRNVPHPGELEAWYPLVAWVGGLPLALDLLNRLLLTRATTREALLRHSAAGGDDVRSIDAAVDAIRPHVAAGRLRGIAETFEMSLANLTEEERLGATCVAWLAPTPVPESLAQRLSSFLPDRVRATLAARSFVTPVRTDVPTFGRMHRLLAAYLRGRTDAPHAHVCQIVDALTADGELRKLSGFMPEMAASLPHFLELFERLASLPHVDASRAVRFGIEAGSLAIVCGAPSAARRVYDRCLAFDPATVASPERLALLLDDAKLRAFQRDESGARLRAEALLREPSLSDNAVTRADTVMFLAGLRQDEGEVDTIVDDLLEANRIVTAAIAGTPSDPRTLAPLAALKMQVISQMVEAATSTGRVSTARSFLEGSALGLRARPGPDGIIERRMTYPLRLKIEDALGHRAKSLELLEELAADTRSYMPEDHHEVVALHVRLAMARIEGGRLDDARRLLDDTRRLRPDLFETHSEAICALAMLFDAHAAHDEAAKVWRIALKTSRGGIRRLEVATSYGETLIRAGRADDAFGVVGGSLASRSEWGEVLHVAVRRAIAVAEATRRPPGAELAGVTAFGEFELRIAYDVLLSLADAPVPLVLLEAIEPFVFSPELRAYLARRGVLSETAPDVFVVNRRPLPPRQRHDPVLNSTLRDGIAMAARWAGPEARDALAAHANHLDRRRDASGPSWLARAWQSLKDVFVARNGK